ncbi:hypothetical protein BUE80_DR003525 [Diplocarpon rosae]|nr:hypothetical protein BUE80_DR003525 [Diplocarpon rosae]
MSTPSEKANLARIRDNQRRSRARRKEYLQELEARLRKCELQGVEASSEIQTAARRVADENKKLRLLLAQHGVRDNSIETYLQSSGTNDAGIYADPGASVQVLEQLLSTRQSCCANGTASMASYDYNSSGRATTPQQVCNQSSSQKTSSRRRSVKASLPQQSMTTGTSPKSTTSIAHGSIQGGSYYQMTTPPQMQGPASSDQNRPLLEYDQQFSRPGQLYSQQQEIEQDDLREQLPYENRTHRSPVITSTTTRLNFNNCNYAADIITSMVGAADQSTIRAELGCAEGVECDVDNQLVFNLMDRYSYTGVGL